MNNDNSFDGVWTALVTPFTKSDEIDWAAFESLLSKQQEAGITGVVIAGSTGEGSTLTAQEKLAMVRKARALVGKSVRIMANVGGSATKPSVELAKLAADAGADSLLVVTPPYNKPTLAGLKIHYTQIAAASPLPICLYHVPSRTAQRLSVPQLKELCAIKQVAAVKEATGDVEFFGEARQQCDAAFLSGDDPSYLASLAKGSRGLISVITNILPKPFIEMTAAFRKGDQKQAEGIFQVLKPLIEVLACESNPGPLKAALASRGLCQNILRAPLAPVSEENQTKIAAAFR